MNLSGPGVAQRKAMWAAQRISNEAVSEEPVLQFSSNNLGTALGLLENDVPLNDVLHKQIGKLIKSPAQTVVRNYFHDDKCRETRNEVARTETESIAQ